MPGQKRRSESKRKFFRAITSRISHHNHVTSPEKDNIKGEPIHSQYQEISNTHNTLGKTNISGNPLSEHCKAAQDYPCPGNDHNTSIQDETQAIKSLSQSIPATKGRDNSNYSYLESMKKAPAKKRSASRPESITPTLNLKLKNSKIRNILCNSSATNERGGKFLDIEACSPASANSEASFLSKTESLIINNESKNDMDEYDYKTFSTNHPLRLSKVKAFEQGEMTTKMFFSKFNSNCIKNKDCNKRNTYTRHSTDERLILQVPGISKEHSASMLGYKDESLSAQGAHESRKLTQGGGTHNNAERRILMMKKALKPMSQDDIAYVRLKNSELPNVFQNSSEFLTNLEPQEIEFWELMNKEFEEEMEALREEFSYKMEERSALVDESIIQLLKQARGSYSTLDRGKVSLDSEIGQVIQKRVKGIFHEKDMFRLTLG